MKGILFTPDNVKAIPEGRKTVTRRIIDIDHTGWLKCEEARYCFIHKNSGEHHFFKPRYHAGETVYVKEAWRVGAWDENQPAIAVDYKQGNFSRKEWLPVPEDFRDGDGFGDLWIVSSEEAHEAEMKKDGKVTCDTDGNYHWKPGNSPCHWRSPLFMPEWAARYFILIEDVRAERLQAITEEDVVAEGIVDIGAGDLRAMFAVKWCFINPKHPWAGNWWVWRIAFKRVERPE